jgi:hypothetical protein
MEINDVRMLGSVALSIALGAGSVGLVSIPTSTHAAWKIESLDDDPTVAQASKRGLLAARELDGQSKAALEIACVRGRQQLLVSMSADLARETIAIRYRINDQPQKQTAFTFNNQDRLSIRDLLPAEIGFAKRLRLELIRNERPTLLFNFDAAGANDVVNAIRC